MDRIIGDFSDCKKCIDDSIIWDNTIEDNFHRVCLFLDRCSKAGCVFNPAKFQFGEETVKYLGFKVTSTGITPTEGFLDSIINFPTPKTLTDIRSWYGAVNQISYAFAIAPIMQPFRHLLSSKVPFYWDGGMDKAFEASKLEIVRQCEKGVRSFTPNAPTALATDWSKYGMGFWLAQKFCKCEGDPMPGCCNSGWQSVYCGSRFCTPAEANYHPIEGEVAAAMHGLDKCRHFVLGLENLILCVDHKPLLGILGDQGLADIQNPRLMNFKLKSLAFRFKPVYIKGKDHIIPDTWSRRNDSPLQEEYAANPRPKSTDLTARLSNQEESYMETISPPTWLARPTPNPTQDMTGLQPSLSAIQEGEEIEAMVLGYAIAALASYNDPSEVEVLSWSRLESACLQCPSMYACMS